MNKKEFKILVKECLLEILAEGLSQTSEQITETKRVKTQQAINNAAPKVVQHRPAQDAPPISRTIADKIAFLPSKKQNAAASISALSNGDDTLRQMFEDTLSHSTSTAQSLSEVTAPDGKPSMGSKTLPSAEAQIMA